MSGTSTQYKYAVVKIKDIDKLLDKEDRELMYRLLNTIIERRKAAGKSHNKYIVVNTDEPFIHEIVSIIKKNEHADPGGVSS